jgi:cyclic pyranopterin phosphate synthase
MPDSDIHIGFISPHSHNFCHECNRVRVTADGRLLLCLGNENSVDLKQVLREYPDDIGLLQQTITESLQRKPRSHHFDQPDSPQILRFMNATGG